MPVQKLKQFQYECDTWKRLLGFMADENVHLKNRLSEFLKNGFDNSMLDGMENFQSNFIDLDEQVVHIREHVTELDKLLLKEPFEDGNILKEIKGKMARLRKKVDKAEKQFSKAKSAFNNYVTENIDSGK